MNIKNKLPIKKLASIILVYNKISQINNKKPRGHKDIIYVFKNHKWSITYGESSIINKEM